MKLFRFHDENTRKNHFIQLLGPKKLLKEFEEDFDSFYTEKICPEMNKRFLETKYGIHDVSFDSGKVLLGFTTYEVKKENWKPLMTIWAEIFKSLGVEIGEII